MKTIISNTLFVATLLLPLVLIPSVALGQPQKSLMKVTNATELYNALGVENAKIEVSNSITLPSSITLQYGQQLVATQKGVMLAFAQGDGIALEGNNVVRGLAVQTASANRAIYISSTRKSLGTIELDGLTVTGNVQLIMRNPGKQLAIKVNDVDIVSADARAFSERPLKYGVIVYQGAFTVYNYNPQEESEIKVRAENISVGRSLAPVLGSGIFISGFGDDKGLVSIERLTTGGVYSSGLIPQGQPNLITGGIFIVYGATAKEIISNKEVVTYGTNDMALDVWGKVGNWVAKEKVITYGASGIGFVNFGEVNSFKAENSIETYGLGARGFNQYDGTIGDAYFYEIVTAGDGAIGMQISKPVGKITIEKGVVTKGSKGETLVKGEIKTLSADGISVLNGGVVKELIVNGDIRTEGDGVTAYNVDGGKVEKFNLKGKLIATGANAKEKQVK